MRQLCCEESRSVRSLRRRRKTNARLRFRREDTSVGAYIVALAICDVRVMWSACIVGRRKDHTTVLSTSLPGLRVVDKHGWLAKGPHDRAVDGVT